MLHEVRSPLLPVRLGPPPDRALNPVDGLGAAIDLLRHAQWHSRVRLESLVPLIANGLVEQRLHFALTDDHKPWGLAVWHWADNSTHGRWLEQPPVLKELVDPRGNLGNLAHAGSQQHLWFSLLVTPFCSSLPLLRQLKSRIAGARNAWAINPYGNARNEICPELRSHVRSVW